MTHECGALHNTATFIFITSQSVACSAGSGTACSTLYYTSNTSRKLDSNFQLDSPRSLAGSNGLRRVEPSLWILRIVKLYLLSSGLRRVKLDDSPKAILVSSFRLGVPTNSYYS